MLVDYEERLYAAGKISGSRWIKREGRPSDEAVLAARLIDRPIRPLFPKDYRNDIQVVITVLSYDGENDPETLSVIAASTALLQAGLPFKGPVGAIRIGLLGDEFILNPTNKQLEESKIDLTIATSKEKVMMIGGKAKEVSEDIIVKASEFALKKLQPVLRIQESFANKIEKEEKTSLENELFNNINKIVGKKLKKATLEIDKEKREAAILAFEKEVLENLEGDYKQVDIK